MSSTPTQLVRATATTTTSTVLFTNTNGNTTIVSTIVLTNASASNVTVTVNLAGLTLLGSVSVAANSTVVIDNVRQVLTGTQTITGGASVGSAVGIHISGTVVSP